MFSHSCNGLVHGGRLRDAAKRYDIPLSDWLDLSTGINPHGWLCPPLPTDIWQRLPEDHDGLETAAQSYYAAQNLLAVAGSQAAIQSLPHLFAPCKVAVIHPGYNEHAHAWKNAGHHVTFVSPDKLSAAVLTHSIVVVINPNNPGGELFSNTDLMAWHKQLSLKGGTLIVDEAFLDTAPTQSVIEFTTQPGLIVLRSLGKFFGLAGARVGFVFAEASLLTRLHALLGPWTLSTASRWVARHALADRQWQHETRAKLISSSKRLETLLTECGLPANGTAHLFKWIRHDQANYIYEQLAQRGILIRLFTSPASVRVGLPKHAHDWQRFTDALHEIMPSYAKAVSA